MFSEPINENEFIHVPELKRKVVEESKKFRVDPKELEGLSYWQ